MLFRIKNVAAIERAEILLDGLTDNESIGIQETGLGGRRHMGCGVFEPSNAPNPEQRHG